MTGRDEQLDPIETALRELRRAEQAGVFEPTRLDHDGLVRPTARPATLARQVRAIRWLTAAAVVAVAVGVGSLVFRSPLTSTTIPNGKVSEVAVLVDGVDPCDGSILRCLAGPSDIVLASGCRPHDRDADGDVDLADFGSYQLTCRGLSPRTR